MVRSADAVHAVTLVPPLVATSSLASTPRQQQQLQPQQQQQVPAQSAGQASVLSTMTTSPVPSCSSVAFALRDKLQPPPPADLTIDMCAAGSPPQLYVSATVTRAADGFVLESLVVSAGLDAVAERVALLEEAAREAETLLSKVEMLVECTKQDSMSVAL
mmetsp:Transcript_14069/g.36399  ORF Transcript_14069/g.36399 Transcript_14069/m.36399 type:complete len:160 (+) Transcript_14069:2-481(+)